MLEIQEGKLTFSFPNDWRVSKYDDWAFYRKQFLKLTDPKAVDILAVDPHNRQAWLIEVKDYRKHPRTKPMDLPWEIAIKMRDSLAGLACAGVNASDTKEQQLAHEAVTANSLRVVLHLEQPAKHSKLFPRAIDPADIQQKLRKLVKAIDPHPLVIEKAVNLDRVPWSVH
ncbi:MAG: hypothetical protein SD837_00615 [Candidatus Electrothrix scaldis]|nr:MAG: hypothetical protein SD837_00615 [Candidatus Electrothrix sp. GW3-3]